MSARRDRVLHVVSVDLGGALGRMEESRTTEMFLVFCFEHSKPCLLSGSKDQQDIKKSSTSGEEEDQIGRREYL